MIKIPGTHIVITTKGAVAAVRAFAGNELDNAVVAAKKTDLGQAAVSVVGDLENSTLSGGERMVKAVADLAPVVISYAARGGFAAVAADVETFARQLLESTLADLRKTRTGAVAAAVLQVAQAA